MNNLALKKYGALFLLVILQIIVVVKMAVLEEWGTSLTLKNSVVSVLSLLLLFILMRRVFGNLKSTLALWLNIIFSFLYILLQIYHLVRHESLKYLLIYKNGEDLFHKESIDYIVSNAPLYSYPLFVCAIAALIFLQKKTGFFSITPAYNKGYKVIIVLIILNALFFPLSRGYANEYFEFFDSIKEYYTDYTVGIEAPEAKYPYVKQPLAMSDSDSAGKEQPHVFIVMLESFSARYMNRIENGKPVTPFLDSMATQGVYVDKFYSTSVETSNGQFTTLCSVYPSYKLNVFTSYDDNNYRCLSHILREEGYATVFLKAFHSLAFENTGGFVMKNGWEFSAGMDDRFITKKEREEQTLGWGVRDDLFYKKTFSYLDSIHETDKRPFFVTTMSVTNHMMFDHLTDEFKHVYPEASNHHENYTNSMRITDTFLREFFVQLEKREYLKNSIVIVTGDNGFPMGQHQGNYHNTKTAYNELFHIPLLVLWNGKLEPAVIDSTAYSQVDIAPTLLDLMNIKTENHFLGTSIFKERTDDYFVPIVQPFDGTILGSIRYPWKYTKNMTTGQEQLFNLEEDPGEKKNIIDLVNNLVIDVLTQDLNTLLIHEKILKEDRVYYQ